MVLLLRNCEVSSGSSVCVVGMPSSASLLSKACNEIPSEVDMTDVAIRLTMRAHRQEAGILAIECTWRSRSAKTGVGLGLRDYSLRTRQARVQSQHFRHGMEAFSPTFYSLSSRCYFIVHSLSATLTLHHVLVLRTEAKVLLLKMEK